MGGRSVRQFHGLLASSFFVLVTTSLVACGGEVRTGSTKDPDVGDEPTTSDPIPDPTTKPSGGSGNDEEHIDLPEVELPECKLGVKRTSETQKCVYLYDDRCYDEKLEACGCACKKQRGTTCASGFPDEKKPTTVSCY